jgi:hypothetical protein
MSKAAIVASHSDPKVLLRVPKPLLKQLNSATRQSKRSRNSEILCRLSQSFDAPSLTESTAGK